MKITELKCTACNGTLKVDENNPKIAVCEYCHTKYVLESERDGDARLGTYPQITPEYIDAEGSRTEGKKYGVPITLIVIVSFLLISWAFRGNNNQSASKSLNQNQSLSTKVAGTSALEEEKNQINLSGILASMTEDATGKPADTLTADDLARFSWIKVHSSLDYYRIGYSFDNPYEKEDAALTWLEYSKDNSGVRVEELSQFTGLKRLEIPQSLSGYKLEGLNLIGLTCYAESMTELNNALDHVADLREVTIERRLKSLEGLEQLKGVEFLSVGGSDLTDISGLAGLKQLKSLTLSNCDNITDFSVLQVMTWLEELSIDSKAVKDIGFVNRMSGLESFVLVDAIILNLDSLIGNQSLTSLTIKNCRELQNCDAISGLTGLKRLALEVPNKSTKPNLGPLGQLESLSISGMDTVAFLANMPNLVTLEISRCTIDQTAPFTALGSLKKLTCRSISSYDVDWGFAARIPSLEVLDLTGIATYNEISVVFNMPTIKELYLNGIECELNFDRLQPNDSLEILYMDGVKLYKNVKISGGGGITYIDYDKVTLDEHTDFMVKYPGLRELSLAENKLTDLVFAEQLHNLQTININENYVTDLKPLESLAALRTVMCTGNPVENYRVLSEEVLIVK